MDNAILQELYDYYKEDHSLSQSELIIAMLTRIQEAVGYVSKDVQEEVARLAGVNRGYVAAIIKNLPHLHAQAFRHEIRVCISDRCKARGGSDLLKKLQELLKIKPGQVTKDGVFLLNTEYCMHNCMHGPNLKIDGRIYENVQISQLPQLLEQLRH